MLIAIAEEGEGFVFREAGREGEGDLGIQDFEFKISNLRFGSRLEEISDSDFRVRIVC